MSSKKPKATRKRMISCFAQIVQEHIPGWKIEEIVDVSKIYAAELSRVRGITPANLNTFSNANRTRDPKVMQTFFWTVYGIFRNEEPDFIKGRHIMALYRQTTRGVFFVVREKAGMKHKVVKKVPKKDLGANILSDETIRLTGQRTSKEYPGELRRVRARVQVDGKWRTMVFLTNNFEWAASTIAEYVKKFRALHTEP